MPPHYEVRHAKTILTATGGFLNGYTHTLNPYEGCAFGAATPRGQGCPFCYVRELPLAKFAARPWGDWVRAKINATALLATDIKKYLKKATPHKLRIFMSSSTDPYQGVEARLNLTQQILKELLNYQDELELLVLQTRSPLVERDLEIFRQFGNKIWLSLTLETDDELVRQQFTPTSPSVARRLQTLQKFYQAEIPTQVAISPLLPCNSERFAQLIADRCHRIVVDTFQSGDGSGGVRSARLGIFQQLAAAGYQRWIAADCYQELFQALIKECGAERVHFSQIGFNNL